MTSLIYWYTAMRRGFVIVCGDARLKGETECLPEPIHQRGDDLCASACSGGHELIRDKTAN